MKTLMHYLKEARASNLVFAALLPFIVYFIMSSRNYGTALKVVLGIEENALSLLFVFIVGSIAGLLGLWALINLNFSLRPDIKIHLENKGRFNAKLCFSIQLLFLVILSLTSLTDEFLYSILINWGNPRDYPWIIIVDQNYSITDETKATASQILEFWIRASLIIPAISLFLSFAPKELLKSYIGKGLRLAIFLLNFFFSFYMLLVSHAGYSVGLMTCLRAAFLAYFLASVLGLIWAILTNLQPSKKSSIITTFVGIFLIIFSIFQFAQPKIDVSLVGSTDGRIGIIKGTPQSVTDTIRYGEFTPEKQDSLIKIRSTKSIEQTLKILDSGKLSGALLPPENVGDYPVLWTTKYLPVLNKNLGITSGIVGTVLLLLVGVGIISGMHPLHVFSDFFVDTIRGVPMLVLVLYVGLPLAGAIKNASYEYIDMSIMARGVLAIGIGYSAYMAEIFRAGIEAVPKGQIEAAKTIGLRDWQIARFIVLPQAIAIILPALGNEFIAMLKDTALLSVLSLRDLTQRMREYQAATFQAFPAFNSAALIYIILTLIAASSIKSIDKIINKKNIRKE